MLDSLLQLIAPHYCYGCNKQGTLLCDNCKYDIVSETFSGCIVCLRPSNRGVCLQCHVPYQNAWCVGERSDALESLIDGFKFQRTRYAYRHLAELLDAVVPDLDPETVVVSIPTISSHVRERGYDHARLVARQFAKRRGLRFSPLLQRKTATKQRGVSKKARFAQAREAFLCKAPLDSTRQYLLIDDVFTTGATMQYGTEVLQANGAKNVSIAIIARQPFDDHGKV